MNASWIKLMLAVLWLVPGVALLATELATGDVRGFVVFGRRVSLAWVFLVFGTINLLRWYASRANRDLDESWQALRSRSRRPADEHGEPDPNFDFRDSPRGDR